VRKDPHCKAFSSPPRDKSRQPIPVSEHWVQWRLADPKWVANARERLQNLGWFMKCLKEPLSRLANKQDKTRGTFFEGRFKSVAVLDSDEDSREYHRDRVSRHP
jgi:hypothetical protein